MSINISLAVTYVAPYAGCPATQLATLPANLSGRCAHDLVLFRGQDSEDGGLAGVVQAQDEDAQLSAWLLPQLAQQREETLRAEREKRCRHDMTHPLQDTPIVVAPAIS